MTNEYLQALLDFEEDLNFVEIISKQEIKHNGMFIFARLDYGKTAMTVPFVYYAGQDWLFTPRDWQGKLPESVEEIPDTEWRVNDTGVEGVIFDGVPMLAPWADEIKDSSRNTRKRIGNQLKRAREEKGISVRGLAQKSGIDKTQISRIESGRLNTTIDTVTRLAEELNLKLNLIKE